MGAYSHANKPEKRINQHLCNYPVWMSESVSSAQHTVATQHTVQQFAATQYAVSAEHTVQQFAATQHAISTEQLAI